MQHRGNDFESGFCANYLSVVFVDGIEIAIGFFSQYYARHVLPT
ncbi:hypothetical protein EMIT0P4_30266 [Pseudomonas sp. IT-P4]